MIKKTIRQGDDFKTVITFKDREGVTIDSSTQLFKYIYRDIFGNSYEVSYDGVTHVNCIINDNHLVGIFENYTLTSGVLKREEYYHIQDNDFSDGFWNHGKTVQSSIELTRDGGAKEVEEVVEVPDGICINETLVVSKGDKGDAFVYEDFTAEQLANLRGDDGDTPFINGDGCWCVGEINTGIQAKGIDGAVFTPSVDAEGNVSWTNDGGLENPPTKNIQGVQGIQGCSSYDFAVKAGYTGTEAQFSAEQAAIADNSARLEAVEIGKASLGNNGYVEYNLIDPLQNRATGVELEGNNCFAKTMSSHFVDAVCRNSFSVEFFYDSNSLEATSPGTFESLILNNVFMIYRQYNGLLQIQLINKKNDGTYERVNLSGDVYNGLLHLVLIINRITNEFSLFINGAFREKRTFTASISAISDTTMMVGSDKPGAAKLSAKHARIFNYSLSAQEVNVLYNNGNPQDYRINYGVNSQSENRCISELLPEGLTPNRWINTIDKDLSLSLNGVANLTYGRLVGSTLTPLFVARGAVYNTNTGYYELNGLTDITEPQMIVIYIFTAHIPCSAVSCKSLFFYNEFRTNFIPKSGTYNEYLGGGVTAVEASQMFRSKFVPEVINLGFKGLKIKGNCFYWAYSDTTNTRLKRVVGILDITEATLFTSPFGYCEGLETVQIKGCKVSVEIKHSKVLTRDSILYLINNAANTTPIIVTLHPDALTRLTEADIALASSKNITLAA